MKFSNFQFLKLSYPNLYKLAFLSEDLILDDPFAAMVNMKQVTSELIRILTDRNGLVIYHQHNDGLLHSLWQNKMIDEDMYKVLREIELFDTRESELIMDLVRIKTLFHRFHDFTVWFYQTYVDSEFIPSPFVIHRAGRDESLLPLDYAIKNYEGEKYEGQIMRGLKHGQGIYTWRDGTLYEGQWHQDQEHGYGKKCFANGDRYEGYWDHGVFSGHGTYTWLDGALYVGQWQDSFEHGYGTKISSDGTERKGLWSYGEFVYTTELLQ